MSVAALPLGFADPARESQAVFRSAMDALARPGSLIAIEPRVAPPAPLTPVAAALALTLADYETPLWLDVPLAASAEVKAFLRFHTGAAIVDEPARAAFALVAAPERLPPLTAFALGTLDYPDRSTTLILQASGLAADGGWRLAGPGVNGEARLRVDPAPLDFVEAHRKLRGLFPRGVDIFFVSRAWLAGLPRSTIVEA